jgi:hypothetical protein
MTDAHKKAIARGIKKAAKARRAVKKTKPNNLKNIWATRTCNKCDPPRTFGTKAVLATHVHTVHTNLTGHTAMNIPIGSPRDNHAYGMVGVERSEDPAMEIDRLQKMIDSLKAEIMWRKRIYQETLEIFT